jgi:hypothetical protein
MNAAVLRMFTTSHSRFRHVRTCPDELASYKIVAQLEAVTF